MKREVAGNDLGCQRGYPAHRSAGTFPVVTRGLFSDERPRSPGRHWRSTWETVTGSGAPIGSLEVRWRPPPRAFTAVYRILSGNANSSGRKEMARDASSIRTRSCILCISWLTILREHQATTDGTHETTKGTKHTKAVAHHLRQPVERGRNEGASGNGARC